MMEYSRSNNVKDFRRLISALGEHFKSFLNKKNSKGETLLLQVASHGSVDIIQLLIESGADTTATNTQGHDYVDSLSLSLTQLAPQKNLSKVRSVLEQKGTNIDLIDSRGITPRQALFELICHLIESDRLDELNQLKSSIRDGDFEKTINLGDMPKNVKTKQWFFEFYQKSWDLPDSVFVPAPELTLASPEKIYNPEKKNYIQKLFHKDQRVISEYSPDKASFQKQFFHLMDLFQKWGEEEKLNQQGIVDNIAAIKRNFFLPEYSGMQPPIYLESIKKNLESVLTMLYDPEVSWEKKKTEYTKLCKSLAVCSPGLPAHVEEARYGLSSNDTVEFWLAELRTFIIQALADMHNKKHGITSRNSIHTFIRFADHASSKHWSPMLYDPKVVAEDPHEKLAKVTDEDLLEFEINFMKEYTLERIREWIKTKIEEKLLSMCNEVDVNFYDWNASDYGAINERLSALFEKMKIKISSSDYFYEFRNNYTEFRLDVPAILNKLCESKIPRLNFFNPLTKKYADLIPKSWMRLIDEEKFDFNMWGYVSTKEFPALFFDVLEQVPEQFLSTFVRNMPRIQLLNLMCNTVLFSSFLEKIQPPEKKKYIHDLVKLHADLKTCDNSIALIAAEHGYTELLEKLVEQKCDVSLPDKEGNTTLHLAAKFGHVDSVTALVGNNPNLVDAKNEKGWLPIHTAAFHDQGSVITAILSSDAKVDVNAETSAGDTPILLAILKNNAKAIKALAEAGVNINNKIKIKDATPLQVAIELGNFAAIRALVESGVLLPTKEQEEKNSNKITSFIKLERVRMAAEKLTHLRDFNRKLKSFIKIAEQKEDFAPAVNKMLFLAVNTGSPELCEAILNIGFDLSNQKNEKKEALLTVIIREGHYAIAEKLLRKTTFKFTDMSISLDLAFANNRIDMIRLLLQHGAVIRDPVHCFQYIKQFSKKNPDILMIGHILHQRITQHYSSDNALLAKEVQKYFNSFKKPTPSETFGGLFRFKKPREEKCSLSPSPCRTLKRNIPKM